jgi:ankyrin repeat protein
MAEFPKLPRIKQDDENMEKMHCAARRGQAELVRRLVSMGISPNIQNKFGCTALHLACKFGQAAAAKELAPVTDLNTPWHGQKPIHLAVMSNNQQIVRILIDGAKEQGKSPDSVLSELDDFETNEIGDHHKTVQGQSALHWCVGLGAAYVPMLKLLVSLGGSPTGKDKNGETPLMRAIEFNNAEAFQILTSVEKLRLDICDKFGRSHLHYALLYNRKEFAAKLVELGHDLTLEDQDKVSVLQLAMRAAMPYVLDHVLEAVDPFVIQSAPFHNGTAVLPERVEYLPFVAETDPSRAEVIKVFQKKLDAVAKGQTVSTRKPGGPINMVLAPSAPVKKL